MKTALLTGYPFIYAIGISLMFPVVAHSADRRTVNEPVMPASVCAALSPSGGRDQQAIQQAIDHCAPGAMVHLLPGTFTTGPLQMRSGVWLWVDKGATLAASTRAADFDRGEGRCGTLDQQGNGCRPLIAFDHVTGGGIIGPGTIDGRGGSKLDGRDVSWWQLARQAQQQQAKQNVPRLVDMNHARDVTFWRIRLYHSANFHLAMNQVQGITVWGVVIDAPANARNTDGIDPGAATDVTIAHSFIRTGDDNVAIKAGKAGPSRFITLIDNHFYAGHGMSIGSETQSGVSDILVKDLTMDGTTSGLRIKSDISRGGEVTRVDYQRICLRNNRWPINIDTHYGNNVAGSLIPWFHDIHFTDIWGGEGALILAGVDDAHPVQATFNGVRFSPTAQWQTTHARLNQGPEGVVPPLPGESARPVSSQPCPLAWLPFPAAVPDNTPQS